MARLKYKKTVITLIAVFFISSVSALIGYWFINEPLLPSNASPIIISLNKSTTAAGLVGLLKEKKLIRSSRLVLALIRYGHLAHRLKAGVYQINPGERIVEFLYRVVAGDGLHFNIALIEGNTLNKTAITFQQAPYLEYEPSIWSDFKQNHLNAEGLFLADTYQYAGGSNAKMVLAQANRRLLEVLNDEWVHRDVNVPYNNAYELLIAASIIEKETAVAQERYIISGVVMNRLNKHMLLQMDPTVIYGMGDNYNGRLVHKDLMLDSLYNTYKYKGLPPTPIALVGKEAIKAAAHPYVSSYLYYVAKGDGSHQFSQTYTEQKQAINRYKRNKIK